MILYSVAATDHSVADNDYLNVLIVLVITEWSVTTMRSKNLKSHCSFTLTQKIVKYFLTLRIFQTNDDKPLQVCF